jgi:outer membrane protein assembly factor BamE
MRPLLIGPALRPLAVLVAAAMVTLALPGCQSAGGWVPSFLQPYRPDVQQGNVVTREMADQLREGMSREQVRFLLGTPLLVSVFHQDRWDYVYRLQRGRGNEVQMRRLTVFFKDNRMVAFKADELPAETMADNLILGRERKPILTPSTRATDPGRETPGPIY